MARTTPRRNVTSAAPAAPARAKDDLLKYALQKLPEHTVNALLPTAPIDDVFAQYSQSRDEMLQTPFANNATMAMEATPFTILRTGEAKLPDMNDQNLLRDKIVYFVELQDGYMHTDSTGKTTEHKAGDKILIAFDTNDVRERDRDAIDGMLENYGGRIPNCALQQYPARKAGFDPSAGIVHVKNWKPLSEMR